MTVKKVANQNRDNTGKSRERITPNVRQMSGSTSPQNQILSALDVLGAKLVRSESERETMRRLLNEALDAQERLENQMERSQMDIQRRIDRFENEGGLSDDAKTILDVQSKLMDDTRAAQEEQSYRQTNVEDKLRDSLQTIAKLQRRIDAQEQKRARLQRRLERVENIASEVQNALEAKALVLLTDQTNQIRALPHLDATAPIQALDSLHQSEEGYAAGRVIKGSSFPMGLLVAGSVLAMAVAGGLGWFASYYYNNREDTAPVMGQMAPQRTIMTGSQFQTNIDDELALVTTDWVIEDFLNDALGDEASGVNEPVQAAAPVITLEPDTQLPASLKPIEDKAFAGIPEAQHDLAALYTAGQAGVAVDYERAAYWFTQAANQGIGNAAYNLGVLHHQGLGQQQNLEQALNWYARAAQLGHPEAQYNLGIAYIEGLGTQYNPNMAASFFQQAALGGIPEAAYNLGLILENGLLGEIMPEAALKWYRGAAESGSVEAEAALASLSRRLGLDEAEAGFLDNGDSLAGYMMSPANLASIEPGSEDQNSMVTDINYNDTTPPEEVSLGQLLPSRQQIVIAQIQEQLRRMQYYEGIQDGIANPDTVKAIQSYQIREGMSADGVASEELLSHMLSGGNL